MAKRFHQSLDFWPNLDAPVTLQERILWRKLNEDMSEAVGLTDKVAVRDYVAATVGPGFLVPALAISEKPNEIDFDALPEAIVVKVNHESGVNMIIPQRSAVSSAVIRRRLKTLLGRRYRYGIAEGEHWYADISPKVLVEPLLTDQHYGLPIDIRFHVFHGRTAFIQVQTGKRIAKRERSLRYLYFLLSRTAGPHWVVPHAGRHMVYTPDWQIAPFQFRNHLHRLPPAIPRPTPFAQMQQAAESLAGAWGYVRVDMYCIDDSRVYFSEMTFAPNSGLFGFLPTTANEELGQLWHL